MGADVLKLFPTKNTPFHYDKKAIGISEKVLSGKRINVEEAIYLYRHAGLPLLGGLANHIKEKKYGKTISFIKNIHIEYTNLCINKCAFCSFRAKSKEDAWEMSTEKMLELIKFNMTSGIKEVHIVGGIHPDKDIYFWLPMLEAVKSQFPALHIKAFTAAEIDYMVTKAGLSIDKGLNLLKESGLDAIPGGGAEIFDTGLRKKLFPTKTSWQKWIEIHRKAHKLGIVSNATMLYGHIETLEQRLVHLEILRSLQDETSGFNAFIPLKFKNKNNALENVEEASLLEDLKIFALARIFLDNIPHIKAYWPMLGKETAFMATDFGVDDVDGTINNTTAIYSRAGAGEQKPLMTPQEMTSLAKKHGKIAKERDAFYKFVS